MTNEPIGEIASMQLAGTVAEFCAAVAIVANAPTAEHILAGRVEFVEKYFALAMSSPSASDFLGSPETVTYEQMSAYIRAVCEHGLSILGGVK